MSALSYTRQGGRLSNTALPISYWIWKAAFCGAAAEEVPLRPKTFEVLAYLVKHHGRLVTKTALIEMVWPDTAITDNSLAQCLVDIRRALGDDSQQLIRTVKGRGYVFAAPVTTPVSDFRTRRQDASAAAGCGPEAGESLIS